MYILCSARSLLTSADFSNSFLLVRHPHVLSKLRAEVASACNSDAELSRTDLRNMKYLQNVLKESRSRASHPPPFLRITNACSSSAVSFTSREHPYSS